MTFPLDVLTFPFDISFSSFSFSSFRVTSGGGGSFSDQRLGPHTPHGISWGFGVCSPRLVTPPPPRPSCLSFPFIPSCADSKMPLPQTEASGPEPHRPQEPVEPHTPAQGARRASSEDAPRDRPEGSRPGRGTLRRAFSRVSQRASGQAPRGDAGLLRLSGRFLFRSLRRTSDNGPAGDQTGATSEPGPAGGRKGSSKAKEGVGRRSSTGTGPEEAEGEPSCPPRPAPATEQGWKPRPEREGTAGPRLPHGLPSPATPNPCPCTTAW